MDDKRIKYRDYISEYTFKGRDGPKYNQESIKFGEYKSKEDHKPTDFWEESEQGKNKSPEADERKDTFLNGDEKYRPSYSGKYNEQHSGSIPDRRSAQNNTRVTDIPENTDFRYVNKMSEGTIGVFSAGSEGVKNDIKTVDNASGKYKAIKKTIDATKKAVKKASEQAKHSSQTYEDDYNKPDNKQYSEHKVLSRVEKTATDVLNVAKTSISAQLALITLVSFLLTLLIVAVTTTVESTRTVNTSSYPESVLQWQSFVIERCAANNDPDNDVDLTKFTAAILTTIWQESGGRSEGSGGDLMQCRASGLWNEAEKPAGWSTEQYSIDVGIRYFYMGLQDWDVTDPTDYTGLQVVAQGYNYSWHYLNFMRNNGYSSWTLESSTAYAASRGGHYGHVTYGSEWLEKYQSGGSAGEAAGSAEFQKMKACADQYLGFPYVWGGKTPETSFDCSGFVCWVINNSGNGWDIGYKDANGLKEFCSRIDESQAQPGDLVFFYGTYGSYGPDYATHVGIYVGAGTIVHSSSSAGVAYKDITTSSYHQQHLLCYGRLPFMSMSSTAGDD